MFCPRGRAGGATPYAIAGQRRGTESFRRHASPQVWGHRLVPDPFLNSLQVAAWGWPVVLALGGPLEWAGHLLMGRHWGSFSSGRSNTQREQVGGVLLKICQEARLEGGGEPPGVFWRVKSSQMENRTAGGAPGRCVSHESTEAAWAKERACIYLLPQSTCISRQNLEQVKLSPALASPFPPNSSPGGSRAWSCYAEEMTEQKVAKKLSPTLAALPRLNWGPG